MHAGPAEVIGDPCRFDPLGQFLQRAEVIEIERRGRSDRHGNPVHDDRIIGTDAIQHGERLAARHHVIFRQDFKPVDRRLLLENIGIIDRPQTEAETEGDWVCA